MTNDHIDYDIVPGTNHLVDLDGSMDATHANGKDREIVLIPTPSDDPDDPLNWTPRRKMMAVVCMVVFTFGVGIPSAAIYSVLTPISQKTNIAVADLNHGTGYMFLFFGLGCLIFQPLALQFGKRPVYLFSMLATTLICVWSPYCTSNGEWIGSKILQGLLGAPIESLPEISISDIFFEHERGTWMGVYAVSLLVSNFIAPLVAGFIADGQEWQWVMFWCAIWGAVCFFFLVVFMEETNYHRVLTIPTASETADDDSSAEHVRMEIKAKGSDIDIQPHGTKQELNPILSQNENLGNEAEIIIGPKRDFSNKKTKTLLQKMSLKPKYDKFLLPYYMTQPFLMATFPSVLWAGALYGISLMFFNILNATESAVLSSPPYNFSAAMCGLAYISPVIFSLIFYTISGLLADYFKVKLARKRNGVSYAEDRLWVLAFYTFIAPCSLILWGVGAYHNIHWFGLVIGMGLLGGAGILGCSASVTYVVDSYKEMSSGAMATVIVIRNCISFAIGYGINPWITNTGYQNTFIAACFIALACIGSFYMMILTGPYWRNRTKARYWKFVAHKRAIGAAH